MNSVQKKNEEKKMKYDQNYKLINIAKSKFQQVGPTLAEIMGVKRFTEHKTKILS